MDVYVLTIHWSDEPSYWRCVSRSWVVASQIARMDAEEDLVWTNQVGEYEHIWRSNLLTLDDEEDGTIPPSRYYLITRTTLLD